MGPFETSNGKILLVSVSLCMASTLSSRRVLGMSNDLSQNLLDGE
jgi:hypothetical protein